MQYWSLYLKLKCWITGGQGTEREFLVAIILINEELEKMTVAGKYLLNTERRENWDQMKYSFPFVTNPKWK